MKITPSSNRRSTLRSPNLTFALRTLSIRLAVCLAVLTMACAAPAEVAPQMFGVNLSGGEHRPQGAPLPGIYGTHYSYPTQAEMNYYKGKNLNFLRIPIRWERIQHTLAEDINETEMQRIDSVITFARNNGMKILLDLHNYNIYEIAGVSYQVGSPEVPHTALSSVWKKLAARYKNETAIYGYDIMNEPKGTLANWQAAAQLAVNAIRTEDTTHWVFIEGINWSGAQTWAASNRTLNVTDSANRLVYSAHSYWNSNHNDIYQSYATENGYPTMGVDQLEYFVEWIKSNGYNGHIGEFGVPYTDPANWNPVLENALSYLQNNGLSATYWAGGPRWASTYLLGCEPNPLTNPDKPQMAVIQKYLGEQIIEAETIATATATDAVTPFYEAALSYGAAEKVSSNAINDYISYTVPVPLTGNFTTKVGAKKYGTRGRFQLTIDGVAQGGVQDQYGGSSYVEYDLGPKTFSSVGNKVFTFTVTGKSSSSTGYDLTFDYIKLDPVPTSSPVQVILDTESSTGITITGDWPAGGSSQPFYGPDYRHDNGAAKGTKSIRYTPNIPSTGTYKIYTKWSGGTSRANNVPIDVTSSTGLQPTFYLNQQPFISTWTLIGTYTFNAGTGGSVLVRTTGTTGFVMADAMKFVKQ